MTAWGYEFYLLVLKRDLCRDRGDHFKVVRLKNLAYTKKH